jgi:hypothetical protein
VNRIRDVNDTLCSLNKIRYVNDTLCSLNRIRDVTDTLCSWNKIRDVTDTLEKSLNRAFDISEHVSLNDVADAIAEKGT